VNSPGWRATTWRADSATRSTGRSGTVAFAYFSKLGKYLVVGTNADARTEIRVYEAATHRLVPLPSVPVGEINGVEISANEQSMALYVNGSRSPRTSISSTSAPASCAS